MNLELRQNVDISHLSNYKTPAKAQYLYTIENEDSLKGLCEIYSLAQDKNLPILIISSGTNMLFAFDTYPGIIVHNTLRGWRYNSETQLLETYGSELIWYIAEELEKKYDTSIWHRFIGLPGSIAGAVYGNAGCFGLETSGNFVSCRVYNTHTGSIELLSKEAMNFGYRYSILKEKKHLFLVSALFNLSCVVEKYSSDVDNIYFREHMQPKGNSCGSFFKNPTLRRDDFISRNPELSESCPKNISAGFLLEQVGLKGFRYGGAYFSDLHSNFLMHTGQGKWTDLLYLIRLAENKVWDRFGVKLENEVQIIEPN